MDQGYSVTAIDASAEMARVASEWMRHPVLHERVETYEPTQRFNGIWASASLLHLPRHTLPHVLQRVAGWLDKEGVFYMSFKRGEGERETGGRRFTDLNKPELRELIENQTPLAVCEVWTDGDVSGRSLQWVSAIARQRND
jgi:hypothetical protein